MHRFNYGRMVWRPEILCTHLGKERAAAELESAAARSLPQRIYGRMVWRPEILCTHLGKERAAAELK